MTMTISHDCKKVKTCCLFFFFFLNHTLLPTTRLNLVKKVSKKQCFYYLVILNNVLLFTYIPSVWYQIEKHEWTKKNKCMRTGEQGSQDRSPSPGVCITAECKAV